MLAGSTYEDNRQQVGTNTQVRALSLEDSILKNNEGLWGEVCGESQEMCTSIFDGVLSLTKNKKITE